jgi:hypothetical protein
MELFRDNDEWMESIKYRFTNRYQMIRWEIARQYRIDKRTLYISISKNSTGYLTLDGCSFKHRVGLAAYEKDTIQPQDVLDIAQSQTDGSFTVNLYLGYVVYP